MWGGARERSRYSHKEGHQLDQGLFLGAGGKLGDHLDDFVHDAAQVVLELLPAFLHKLGVLGRRTDRCAQLCFPHPLGDGRPGEHATINHRHPERVQAVPQALHV